MKKVLFAILITVSVAVTGCSKKDTPENAANAFMNSFVNGDIKTFKKYSTPQTQTLFAMAMAMTCSKQTLQNDPGKCLKKLAEKDKKYEIVSTEKLNNNEAVVTLKEILKDGKTKTAKIPVIKTKDGWKVNVKK